MRILFALILTSFMVWHGLAKKALSTSGLLAASFVGLITFSSDEYVFGVILLTFYLSSSRFTKLKAELKKQLEEDYLEGGQRTATQVFSNALTGTVLVLVFGYFSNGEEFYFGRSFEQTIVLLMYIGHYACCCGDTWASELGVLNTDWPILITNFERVPPGTNGGISPIGTLASLLGGKTIGIVATITLAIQHNSSKAPWILIGVGIIGGLVGSLIDSFLGATVQRTYLSKSHKIVNQVRPGLKVIAGYDILDNHQVNFISSLATSVLMGAVGYYMLA
ncbi:DUF92-domain-containing protein [Basidiobolus meristosporus CBS 931.73]|uniref:DUF92-domain-containing protein n=1 Tax=Basidiobolus meristosporus CBS 931.73 TaxID=1314790 RepID=A0A1Y1Y8I9_9FUNG|nr:DUF92-domain-containing protein [Basidiobolus meristosporus CBS 931.73]|eukprot:ORX94317.1 DUF92-domain-containing protein [Basidiobolus meristosporus CBS 931.73]